MENQNMRTSPSYANHNGGASLDILFESNQLLPISLIKYVHVHIHLFAYGPASRPISQDFISIWPTYTCMLAYSQQLKSPKFTMPFAFSNMSLLLWSYIICWEWTIWFIFVYWWIEALGVLDWIYWVRACDIRCIWHTHASLPKTAENTVNYSVFSLFQDVSWRMQIHVCCRTCSKLFTSKYWRCI